MARTYAALALDWDGTAVPERTSPTRALADSLELLTRYGVHVAIVTGSSAPTLLRQLRPWPQRDGDLLACVDRGARVLRLHSQGAEVLFERLPSSEEDHALDRAASALVSLLRRRGLDVPDAVSALGRRQVNLLPNRGRPPKARVLDTLGHTTGLLRTAGFDALSDVVATATGIAAASGLHDPRVSTDAQHVEISLTSKGDAARWLVDRWWSQGIGPGLALVLADQFGPLGGAPGSDEGLLVHPMLSAISVGVEPGGVPTGVEHRGGGPRESLRIVAEQVRRHRTRAVPDVSADAGWIIRVTGEPERERIHESLLALSEGGFGVRGSWEEVSPSSAPATFAAGVYDGPDQHLLPGPVWTTVGRAATPRDERLLDVRTGVLVRRRSDGATVSSRFLCRGIAGAGLLRVSGQLPRAEGPALRPPTGAGRILSGVDSHGVEWMVSAGADSGIAVAAVSAVGAHMERIVGMVADRHGVPDYQAATQHAMAVARVGHDRLLARHRHRWAQAWFGAAIDIPDDPELELQVRFALFHLLSAAGATSDDELALGVRGVTGAAYGGHVLWDADAYVLPVLAALAPQSARAMLEYRVRRVAAARQRAHAAGYRGLRFPWESAATGEDVTPVDYRAHGRVREVGAGPRQDHITGDVAWAAAFYAQWTGDTDFADGVGADLIAEVAEYWLSRLTWESGRAHVRDVQGPDEYHDHVDDDAYTVHIAGWCLRTAADLLSRRGEDFERAERYREAAKGLCLDPDPDTGVHEQHAGYFGLVPMTVADVAPTPVALDLVVNPALLSAAQAIKMPDVLLAHHLLDLVGDPLPLQSLMADLEFYGPRTAHGSSLSPGIHAAVLGRLGRGEEALHWLRIAAAVDLQDRHGLAAGGLRLGAMASVWHAIVLGLVGARVQGSVLHLDPQLPDAWSHVVLRLRALGAIVHLDVRNDRVGVWSDGPIRIDAGGRTVERIPAIP